MPIHFPEYRTYEQSRIAANDAMMALLIGSRLGAHTLDLNTGSRHFLPDIFPVVQDIRRMNRTVEDAQRLMREAERHLAYMAIPFVLTVHGTLLVSMVEILRKDGKDTTTTDPNSIPLAYLHEHLEVHCGNRLPADELHLFHFARRARNRIIHYGGISGSELLSEYNNLDPAEQAKWTTYSGRPFPATAPDEPLKLETGELIGVLAITKHLAEASNDMLAVSISRPLWATIVVEDYRSIAPERFRDTQRRRRSLPRYAKQNYKSLGLTERELEVAIASL